MTSVDSAVFYDSLSMRMRVTSKCYSATPNFHRGRRYEYSGGCTGADEPYSILANDDKIIGCGFVILDINHGAKPPELRFRSAVNALNAVVDGRRNDLNLERDAFAELCANRITPLIYWWFTETWADFVKQVKSLDWPIVESFPIWNGDPFVWEGVVNGKPAGDCIVMIDDEGDPAGFKLATENIPQFVKTHS